MTSNFKAFCTLIVFLLLLAGQASAQKAKRTIMVYNPVKAFALDMNGSALSALKVRGNANADIKKPLAGDWWSVTIEGDSSQYYFAFNDDGYAFFFQPMYGTNSGNDCYDASGNVADQNTCNSGSTRFPKPGAWTNDTIWIVPEINVPNNKPQVFFKEPLFRTFYFLPPNDDEWNQGVAQMVIDGGAPVTFYPDDASGRCGWYKKTYINVDPPSDLVIALSTDPDNYRIGAAGVEEEEATTIDLLAQFNALGSNEIYFTADAGTAGWTAAYGGESNSCGYPLAAFIFDSDAELHTGFSEYMGIRNTAPCIGVKKGIVESVLDPNTKKPVYRPSSGCFDDAATFNQLFVETPGVNKQHCKDLPFTRAADGLWEFDSFNEPDGGYYPLESEPNSGPSKKRKAECRVPIKPDWLVKDPVTGLTKFDAYIPTNGEFVDGENPAAWDWGSRTCPLGKDGSPRNQHWCFQTSAEFTYNKGQNFSFRGDDDIWVYINNQLVVDLGGTHLAAPGYVNLDTISVPNKLVAGNKYDIDIFFCDRRTTMSNVRIKTNMFFSQKNGLFAKPDAADTTKNTICMISGSTSSCDALISGKGAAEEECGVKIADKLRYFVTSRRAGDTLWLDDTNPSCVVEGANLTCYGGIRINSGDVFINKAKINGLAGTYIVWSKLKDDPTNPNPPPAARVKKFTTQTDVAVITGLVDFNGVSKDLTPPAGVVAGKRVPIYFASGSANASSYTIDTENGPGKTFTLNQAAGMLSDATLKAELSVYTTEVGGTPVLNSQSFSIPASGLCTLWVAGTYRATDSYTYTINVQGSKGTPVKLEVRLPQLKFVDETFTTDVHAAGTGVRDPAGKILPIMMGTEIKLYLVAYDPAVPDQICETCNFTLSGSSDVPDTTIPRAVDFVSGLKQTEKEGVYVGGIVGGKASISISGSEPVKDPYWAFATIRGLSEKTLATWDSLRFKEPPVPYPLFSGMYDKNGDGKGDSLFIAYNRVLPGDSLPDFVEIWWPESATDSLYLSKSELAAYWNDGDSVIVIDDRDFSTTILTAGVGRLRNTATYNDPDQGGKEVTTGFNKGIVDRLGPVIAQASYSGKDKGCGADATSACTDKIILKFSESVEISAADSATFAAELGNLFTFRLLDYLNDGWRSDLPAYKMSLNDTTATLIYQRYEGTVTPQALDSVKFRGDSVDLRLLRDLEGNFPSNRQIGAKIEGVKPLKIHKVIIGNLNVNDPIIQERLKGPAVTIHAIPPGTSMDSIPYMYPGTVGQVIMVDVPGKLFMLSQGGSGSVGPEDVKFVLGSQYFSNLGSFVVKNDLVIQCTDEMFKGNCIENPAYLYVAWNMFTSDRRFVGSGAYINTLKFYWTAYVNNATLKFDNVDPDGEPYIMGVRRDNGLVGQKSFME